MNCFCVMPRVGLALLALMASASVLYGQEPASAANLDSVPPTIEAIARQHVFQESLHPVGSTPASAENQALLRAVQACAGRMRGDDFSPLVEFISAHPGSAWEASLQVNLGVLYRHHGYFSRAMEAFGRAWHLAREVREARATLLADRAGAELAELYAKFGRTEDLRQLLGLLLQRPLSGTASVKALSAKESLSRMVSTPERNFRCGPLALATLLNHMGRPEPRLLQENGAPAGTSLLYNQNLAQNYKLSLQMAKRQPGSTLLLPAIMHWKSGHFAALLQESNGRYLLKDPTLGEDLWVTRRAVDDEGSGYALVLPGKLPDGWTPVTPQEGAAIMGRGGAPNGDSNATKVDSSARGGPCSTGKGMATYTFHALLASLAVRDTPVGYQPPLGPPVEFLLAYSQKEANQPQTFNYANLGNKWTFYFLAFIEDDPTVATDAGPFSMSVKAYERGGGASVFAFQGASPRMPPNAPSSGPSRPLRDDQSVLFRTSVSTYMRLFADGSKLLYEHSDGSMFYPRRIFLTKIIDRLGNALTINFDGQNRVVSLIDALGRATTLEYGLAGDPLKVTKVTDPFGRSASFSYTGNGLLETIRDPVGIVSRFTYGPTADAPKNSMDFLNALTTPYGTTQFSTGADEEGSWVEAKDPMGGREKIEFKRHPWCAADYSNLVPSGFQLRNPGGTFYWDKRAMAQYPSNRDHALYTRWLIGTDGEGSLDIPHSVKMPENLDFFSVWYAYPGQVSTTYAGTINSPSRIIKTNGDGIYRETSIEYNILGRPTKTTDPLGRQTTYVYPPYDPAKIDDQLDLLEVRQSSNGRNDLLAKYSYKNHLPISLVDASGQQTTMDYTPSGQINSITNPKRQVISLTYNSMNQLTDVKGLGDATVSMTYDAVGRVSTITNPENEVVTYNYDDLDRVTKIIYDNGEFEQNIYDNMDVTSRRDRAGNWTHIVYNPLRQPVRIQDALGRVTWLDWCGCGTLDGLVDPLGRYTSWIRNLEGRVITKIFPDGKSYNYAYDSLGELVQRTDARNQMASYAYNADGSLHSIEYANVGKPAHSVVYEYDPDYPRLTSLVDRTGTTTYEYYPVNVPPALGAGKLWKENTPFANGTIVYAYDELGRLASRSINDSTVAVQYDEVNRIGSITNPLGLFQYQYEGLSGRVRSVALPNGITSSFSYFDKTKQHRLKEISNLRSDNSIVSKFNYDYDSSGQISIWSQQADAETPKVFSYKYDGLGQLLEAHLSQPEGQEIKQFIYGYDLAGNRTTLQGNGIFTEYAYNDANQLVSLTSQVSSNDKQNGRQVPQKASRQAKTAASVGSHARKVKPKVKGATTR